MAATCFKRWVRLMFITLLHHLFFYQQSVRRQTAVTLKVECFPALAWCLISAAQQFLDLVCMLFPLCMVEFQPLFVAAEMNCVHSGVHCRILSVFTAVWCFGNMRFLHGWKSSWVSVSSLLSEQRWFPVQMWGSVSLVMWPVFPVRILRQHH